MTASGLNLIIICPDELRADCVGFMKNPDIRTPHLDSLARSSVIFPQHIANFPKCVPARVALMTGRYSHADGYRTIFQRMQPDAPNLLGRLIEANYQTAVFGKNHCWDEAEFQRLVDYSPEKAPYNEWMRGVPRIRESKAAEGGVQPMPLPPGYDYIGCNTRHAEDEVFVRQTCDFIENRRDRSRPFFVQVNLESPHPKYGVEEPWYSMYDRQKIEAWPHELPTGAPAATVLQRQVRTPDANEAALREIQAVYYGMITKVDEQVGAILDSLRKQGLWDNTVIVFISDHGDYAGQYGLVEKWDTCFTDCLVRTPFTIRAPGLPENHVADSLSGHTDVAPTLLELLGLAPLTKAHGRSLLPVIRGENRIEIAFSEGGHEAGMRARFSPENATPAGVGKVGVKLGEKQQVYHQYPQTMARAAMARSSRYKLVIREDGDNEFYDLQEDPWELHNRWNDSSVINEKAVLLQALAAWQLQTGHDGPEEQYFGA